jgi:hypothetical protein
VRDGLRVVVLGAVAEARPRARDVVASKAKRRGALLAGDEPARLDPFAAELAFECERLAQDLRVESAGEPPVSREWDDRGLADLAPLEQGQPANGRAGTRGAGHQLLHALGIRPHRFDARLGAAKLRRCHELHRARDLPGVPDRADPTLDVLNRGH